MKKRILAAVFAALIVLVSVAGLAEETLSGHAQTIYEEIRWNLNLPKQAQVLHAEEYLFKVTKEITLHTLLMEVSLSDELEAMFGRGGRVVLIDLDTGESIDYKNFDGNVVWPDGDITSKYDALHLLYNCYISYLEGYNEDIMSLHEIIMPVSEEDVAAVNNALCTAFMR